MGMLFDLFVSLYVVIIQVVIGTFISISGILQLQMSPNQGTCTGLLLVFVVIPIVLTDKIEIDFSSSLQNETVLKKDNKFNSEIQLLIN